MHYQFIMANDMRAPYEYMMLVCGPVPVEQWAKRGHDMLARFAAGRDVQSYLRSERATVRTIHEHQPPRQQPRQQRRGLVGGARHHDAPPAHQSVVAFLRDALGRARQEVRKVALGNSGDAP